MIAEIQETQQVWYGCYDGGWKDITPEAFQHPAKFAQGLVRKIYEYGLEMGYIKVGDTILDPFGGVGLGAKYALANGLSWVGCELERRFTDLGQGCDCTGISKADWVRFYGRWDKVAHKDERHWCPQCLAEARKVNPPAPKSFTLSLFGDEPEPSAAYTRNSGVIPETKPHHYTGNLELFRKYAQPGTWAVLLNGDSRNLRAVIGQAAVDGLLSSPPYANSVNQSAQANDTEARIRRMRQAGIDVTNRANVGGANGVVRQPQNYGFTAGQLGGMSEGSLADSLVSSPPYANGEKGHPSLGSVNKDNWGKDGRDIAGRRGLDGNYGGTDGQLANMPLGDSLLSSPPFAGNTGGRGEASRNGIDPGLFDRHSGGMKKGTGDNPANLDHLPMRGFGEALVSSPPFEKQLPSHDNFTPPHDSKSRLNISYATGYGSNPGQLGTEQGTTFWAAARLIVSESYLALKPGSYGFWVVKAFIRDKKRVDFPGQWRQLCEACGFEFVESIYAMQISQAQYQQELNGDAKKIQKATKSFFRRTYEKKFPDNRIDWEEVLILRKPL